MRGPTTRASASNAALEAVSKAFAQDVLGALGPAALAMELRTREVRLLPKPLLASLVEHASFGAGGTTGAAAARGAAAAASRQSANAASATASTTATDAASAAASATATNAASAASTAASAAASTTAAAAASLVFDVSVREGGSTPHASATLVFARELAAAIAGGEESLFAGVVAQDIVASAGLLAVSSDGTSTYVIRPKADPVAAALSSANARHRAAVLAGVTHAGKLSAIAAASKSAALSPYVALLGAMLLGVLGGSLCYRYGSLPGAVHGGTFGHMGAESPREGESLQALVPNETDEPDEDDEDQPLHPWDMRAPDNLVECAAGQREDWACCSA